MGEWVILRKGDLIDTQMLNDFIYQQGDNACSVENQTKCDDEFSFIPFGRLTGAGEYQTSKINLTPVMRESSIGVMTAQGQLAVDEPIELANAKTTSNTKEA